jgi:putative peptide zinc metalloprotease protein
MDEELYFVIPLSVQPDGDDFLIGNVELEDFYQIPRQGRDIIDMLRKPLTPAAIKAALADAGNASIDVDDFISVLRDIGFIYPIADQQAHHDRIEAAPKDKRILFHVDERIAKAIFSPVTLVAYMSIVGTALYYAVFDPALRINWSAFFIERNFALTLVLLLILSSFAVALHELGHMLAAARYGISSKLGLSNRLWNIVAEADLSGIMSIPKRQRYLPLMAGMMVDTLVISMLTLLIARLRHSGIDGFPILLLQALILQIVVTIIWQFNLFLKTDVYYILSNYFSYPDIDRDARIYIKSVIFHLTKGRFGELGEITSFKNLKFVQIFSLLWIFGRIGAVTFLMFIFIPTIYLYITKSYQAFQDPNTSLATAYDLAIFVFISAAILAVGLYMWLKGRWVSR